MVEPEKVYLTSYQMQVIETLKDTMGDISMAAAQLGKNEQQIYNVLHNIRKARKKAQLTVNVVNNWMKEPSIRKFIY